jgi:hypothetical protein
VVLALVSWRKTRLWLLPAHRFRFFVAELLEVC